MEYTLRIKTLKGSWSVISRHESKEVALEAALAQFIQGSEVGVSYAVFRRRNICWKGVTRSAWPGGVHRGGSE